MIQPAVLETTTECSFYGATPQIACNCSMRKKREREIAGTPRFAIDRVEDLTIAKCLESPREARIAARCTTVVLASYRRARGRASGYMTTTRGCDAWPRSSNAIVWCSFPPHQILRHAPNCIEFSSQYTTRVRTMWARVAALTTVGAPKSRHDRVVRVALHARGRRVRTRGVLQGRAGAAHGVAHVRRPAAAAALRVGSGRIVVS